MSVRYCTGMDEAELSDDLDDAAEVAVGIERVEARYRSGAITYQEKCERIRKLAAFGEALAAEREKKLVEKPNSCDRP